MNARRERERFKTILALLDRRSSSKIFMGKLTSKLNKKKHKNYVGNPSQEVHDLKEGERKFLRNII